MKKAFTLLELIMVIVVIGILAAVIIPRTDSNNLAKAAVQVISHIRYTQHLAMVDNKFGENTVASGINWYKKRWQIIFGTSTVWTNGTPAYTIFSDSSGSSTGQPNISEMAINPQDASKVLSGGYSNTLNSTDSRSTQKMNLGSYGITGYDLNGGCSGARISFDNFGRPINGNLSSMTGSYSAPTQRLITQRCDVELTSDEGTIIIAVEPETGYAHIL